MDCSPRFDPFIEQGEARRGGPAPAANPLLVGGSWRFAVVARREWRSGLGIADIWPEVRRENSSTLSTTFTGYVVAALTPEG